MKSTKEMENLVALVYSPKHSSYPEVMAASDIPELEIDLEKGTWAHVTTWSSSQEKQPKKIGEYNYFMKDRSSGVIGVYDQTNSKHLTSMVRDWHDTLEAKNTNWNFVD
ncbi:MAG: hypothetical protein WCI36_01850 [bacterium]